MFGLAVLGALLGILAVGFLIAHADIAAHRFDTAAIAGIVVAGVLLLLPFGVSTVRILRKDKVS